MTKSNTIDTNEKTVLVVSHDGTHRLKRIASKKNFKHSNRSHLRSKRSSALSYEVFGTN